ncbi:PDZ domain-containing protein [Comamonas testosteroni]|uniref:S1C family serine protease n=1 Tax=Comamonas testosteroni TaxID=285 RepID=UPI00265E429A|nr:PDZ domain-containing protein [Comamonas testosteroni]WKL15069.1 PDZ domain-containing protein [Comamonas testosteroni]
MSLNNVFKFVAVVLLSLTLAGCGQSLITAVAVNQLSSETPESVGEVASKYRSQSCAELASEREHALSETTRIGEHTEYSQKRGRWKLAVVEQVEKEKGCVLGISSSEAHILEFISKNPSTAKELDSKLKSPAARKALAALVAPSQTSKSKTPPSRTEQAQSGKPKSSAPVPAKTKEAKSRISEESGVASQAASGVSSSARGWLGVSLLEVPITPVLAASLGLSEPMGVFVQGAVKDSAAGRAGMRSLDVILSADDKEYNSGDALKTYLVSLRAGHKLNLKVWRNRSAQILNITLSDTQPDAMLPTNREGYCYVIAMPPMDGTKKLVWVSDIFPVADKKSQLYSRGQVAGEAFAKFLQQEKVPQASDLKGLGMCSPSLNSLTTSWNAELASYSAPAFKATGSEGVLLYWQPS